MVGGEAYETVEMSEEEYAEFVIAGEERWGRGFKNAPVNFNQLTGESMSASQAERRVVNIGGAHRIIRRESEDS